jgi:molecular chaperone DnaK (HSP70)
MNKIPRAVGIDLGTTNSVMAILHGGEPKVVLNKLGKPLTPSAVSVGRRGELLVGKAAKDRVYDPNTIVSVKRLMGMAYDDKHVQETIHRVTYKVSKGAGGEAMLNFNNRTYTPTEISAIILHQLRLDVQDRLGEPVGRAVITVPAYFNDAQATATREAGRMAGFTVLSILREPTAAALSFGLDRSVENDPDADSAAIMVYDLGGGTFDISLMMMARGVFNNVGILGDKFLGGDDFDYEIMKYLFEIASPGGDLSKDDKAKRVLKDRSEEAKIELSSVKMTSINIAAVAGIDIEEDLEREKFDRMITPWVKHTIELTNKAMNEAEITLDEIDHILLVGGSTLVPYVQDTLAKEFGDRKIRKNVDPMLAVAFGAALETGLIQEIQCPNPECRDNHGKPFYNPLVAEACERCGSSLVGIDVVTCPVCYLPVDARLSNCPKCKSSLQEAIEVSGPAPSGEFWKCLKCEFPRNPVSADRCEMCDAKRDVGGVKCPHCGEINPPGAQRCTSCGKPTWEHFDGTPEDIGIEKVGGLYSIMIPKGSNFDMREPIQRDFAIPEANALALEVVVYQGPHERVEDNEYIGRLLLELPPGLPKNTPVTIGLGLDKDGTIYVSAQLRDYPDRKAFAHLVRTRANLDVRRRDELINQARELVKGREHTPEAADLLRELDQIENRQQALSDEDLVRLEAASKAYEEKASGLRFVEEILADAEFVLKMLKNYRDLMENPYARLESLKNELSVAIARNPAQAQAKAEELDQYLTTEEWLLRVLAYMEAASTMPNISPSLRDRIAGSLRDLRNARTQDEVDGALTVVLEIWGEVRQALQSSGTQIQRIKPGDLRDSRP